MQKTDHMHLLSLPKPACFSALLLQINFTFCPLLRYNIGRYTDSFTPSSIKAYKLSGMLAEKQKIDIFHVKLQHGSVVRACYFISTAFTPFAAISVLPPCIGFMTVTLLMYKVSPDLNRLYTDEETAVESVSPGQYS